MSEKVVSISGATPIGVAKVDPDVIMHLENLLAAAHSGQLHAIAYATVLSDGAVGAGWAGVVENFRVAASLDRLVYRFRRNAWGDEE